MRATAACGDRIDLCSSSGNCIRTAIPGGSGTLVGHACRLRITVALLIRARVLVILARDLAAPTAIATSFQRGNIVCPEFETAEAEYGRLRTSDTRMNFALCLRARGRPGCGCLVSSGGSGIPVQTGACSELAGDVRDRQRIHEVFPALGSNLQFRGGRPCLRAGASDPWRNLPISRSVPIRCRASGPM